MANAQSSFIPKNPINSTVKKRTVRKIYVLTYVVYVLFVATLIGTGGVWFYKATLEAELATTRTNLANEQERFDQSVLERLSELDVRLEEANNLLNKKVSMAALFSALEEVTVSSVTLDGFSYTKDQGGRLQLLLGANANDFNTALYQRSVLATNPILANASLTDVTYSTSETETTSENQLTFKLTKSLKPADLPYVPRATEVETADSSVDSDIDAANLETN